MKNICWHNSNTEKTLVNQVSQFRNQIKKHLFLLGNMSMVTAVKISTSVLYPDHIESRVGISETSL